MSPFDLIRLAAATWYIAYAVSNTAGPFSVFVWIREHLPLGGLTACIICLSVWVAWALLAVGANFIVDGFAVAGVALWIHAYSNWVHISK